jgi:hypothetical protein
VLAVIGSALTWCVNQSSGDSYASQAADIVNRTANRFTELESSAKPDEDRCARGSLASCDRLISTVSGMADEASSARADFVRLKPPSEARSWHKDYLTFLSDGEVALRAIVSAWDAGDLNRLTAALNRLDSLATREESLTSYFNSHLR